MAFLNIDVMMIDPLNPRFVGQNRNRTQQEILSYTLGLLPTRELMNSMMQGLQWVNRIVVRKIDELPEGYLASIPDSEGFEYIVVEGNTRLACLKSETMRARYDDGSGIVIPVLIAEKRDMNSDDFENEIRIIQARANVMIVKQWEDIPKFRHIYNMYQSEKRLHPSDSFSAIVERIKNTTGGKSSEVRTAIDRCMIVDKIAEESEQLEDKYWPFVEAFESNRDTRASIGINENHEFVFDSDNEDYQRELLNRIPAIIKDAYDHLPNGKQFRDKYKEIVRKNNGDVEQITADLEDIMNPNSDNSWVPNQNNPTTEQKWEDDLRSALLAIQNYPNVAVWARNHLDLITSIRDTADRQIRIIGSDE